MYMSSSRGRYAPGMEFLCKPCRESVELPPKTTTLPTHCAQPGCRLSAQGCFEVLAEVSETELTETHYLCGEHGWYWRQSLGAEWEMLAQSISVNGQEVGRSQRFLRDDLRGAFWGNQSDEVH